MARTVLPGGLRVVTEHVAGARSASVGLWVDVGSRDEPGFDPASRGAAHFLEHLLFKGTRRRTARQIAEEIDAVGGDLNAFTSKEHTCFYAHVLDVDMPLAVDVVCDVVLPRPRDTAPEGTGAEGAGRPRPRSPHRAITGAIGGARS